MLRASWGDEPMEITEKNKEKFKSNDTTQKGTVKELAKFELVQRKKEGNEEGFEELSDYWVKF